MEKYKIIISSIAQSDLAECVGFVLNVSKDTAYSLANDIYHSIESLTFFPERNPVFEMPKSFPFIIRKLIINKRYVALYSVEDKDVVIYRILDSRRKLDYIVL